MELKSGGRARVQTEMVEFIALSFPYSSKLKVWSFHVVVVQVQQRNVQNKRDARAGLLFCSLNLLFFWRSPCRRRRSFVRSLNIFIACSLLCWLTPPKWNKRGSCKDKQIVTSRWIVRVESHYVDSFVYPSRAPNFDSTTQHQQTKRYGK